MKTIFKLNLFTDTDKDTFKNYVDLTLPPPGQMVDLETLSRKILDDCGDHVSPWADKLLSVMNHRTVPAEQVFGIHRFYARDELDSRVYLHLYEMTFTEVTY
jgi:hypothetical protein